MKRKISTMGIIALCFVFVGIGVCVLAIGIGAKTSIAIGEGGLKIGNKIIKENFYFDKDKERTRDSSNFIYKEENLAAFKNIEVMLGTLDLEIVEAKAYGIEVDYNKNTKVTYNVVGDTLRVEQDDYRGINIGLFDFRNDIGNQGKVTIFVPTNTVLEEVDISGGVCFKKIRNINMERLELKEGVGETEFENVSITKATIMSGVGDITGSNMKCEDIKIAGGVGDVDLEGTFGDMDITGGVGDVEIETSRAEKVYNYSIIKGLGSISINDKDAEFFKNIEQRNGSDYTIKIRGGVGDVEVYTQ